MEINMSNVRKLQITDAPRLDMINVIIDDIAPGQGRIIIECYGQVWSSYWGAMGDRNISQFFLDCSEDYLLDNLSSRKTRVADRKYLARIIAAVDEAIKLWASFDKDQQAA